MGDVYVNSKEPHGGRALFFLSCHRSLAILNLWSEIMFSLIFLLICGFDWVVCPRAFSPPWVGGNFLPPSHFVYGCFAPTKAPITQHSVTMTKTNKNKNKYKDSITERIEGAKGKYFSNHFQICQIFPDCQISIPSSIGSIQRDASIPQITSHPTTRICNLSLPVTENLCLRDVCLEQI